MRGPIDGEIRAWLLTTLASLAPDFGGEIGDETPLVEGGLSLDSVALLDLVGAIEDRFGFRIAEDEIREQHFGTVARLVRFLLSRHPLTAGPSSKIG
jgi:acyl carrier protein